MGNSISLLKVRPRQWNIMFSHSGNGWYQCRLATKLAKHKCKNTVKSIYFYRLQGSRSKTNECRLTWDFFLYFPMIGAYSDEYCKWMHTIWHNESVWYASIDSLYSPTCRLWHHYVNQKHPSGGEVIESITFATCYCAQLLTSMNDMGNQTLCQLTQILCS